MKRRVAAKLPPQAAGCTLLDYLANRFNYHSRSEWQQKILDGELALEGNICHDPATLLTANALLEYTPANLVEPDVNTSYRIIYEDEYLLVIDKPGNLPVHPAGPYFNNTLWAMLAEEHDLKVHIVNRLDRETSGLLIAAKSSDIAGAIAKTLPDMVKKYQVIVHGAFPQELTAKGFLVKDAASPVRKKQRYVSEDALQEESAAVAVAVETHFYLEKYQNGFSLVKAVLRTGRMHQIRATLHSLGFPVTGDKLYGLDEGFYRRLALDTLTDADREKLVLPHQALHCAEMSFVHPISGKTLTIQSPLPETMASIFA